MSVSLGDTGGDKATGTYNAGTCSIHTVPSPDAQAQILGRTKAGTANIA